MSLSIRLFVTALFFSITMISQADDASKQKSRTFQFTYQSMLQGLAPGQSYRLWVPIPQTNEYQKVSVIEGANSGEIKTESKFGNSMLYVAGKADAKGQAEHKLDFRVTRMEVSSAGTVPGAAEVEMFLKADKLVPIEGKPLSIIQGKTLPSDKMELGRLLYDSVNNHMKYSKEGTGWGRGDSNWACDSRFGNCSDFHSLFISLSRAQKMPAKFEIGFPLPEARGAGEIPGYHCWAFFQPESNKGWVPVDISEANKNPKMANYYFGNLTENRIALTTGRDITLNPPQDGPVLNFFINPYVEVDGKPLPAEKIKKKVTYKDIE